MTYESFGKMFVQENKLLCYSIFSGFTRYMEQLNDCCFDDYKVGVDFDNNFLKHDRFDGYNIRIHFVSFTCELLVYEE